MIRTSLERRLAIVATAALTLAIWVLPASAASAAEISGRKAIRNLGPGDLHESRVALAGLPYAMLYRNKFLPMVYEGT